MDKKILFGIIGILLISTILVFATNFIIHSNLFNPSSNTNSPINYGSNVCVYKNGELVGPCSHNVLYNSGKNMTRNALGLGGSGTILNISLCNASANCATPTAAGLGTDAYLNYTNCGLNPQDGTYTALSAYPGNWTVTKTFISTCDNLLTNVTMLMNASGSIFAGNSFTLVTLQTSDQITINWTIWIV